MAAAEWLAGAGIDPDEERRRGGHWSGLWLHWRRRHEVDDERPVPESLWKRLCEARTGRRGRPPAYYAVIAMDGDHMGRWLAGEKTPALRRLLHPKLRAYFEGLGDPRAEEALDARRPVGPALHAAISAALSTFATEVAPTVVAGHHGALIYSGGDDVLALCPVSTAFACVRSLRDAFSGRDDPGEDGWRDHGGRRRITMGADASMSAGLALVSLRLPGRAKKIHEKVCRSVDHVPIREVWRAGTMTGAVRWDLGPSGIPGTCASSTSNEKTRR